MFVREDCINISEQRISGFKKQMLLSDMVFSVLICTQKDLICISDMFSSDALTCWGTVQVDVTISLRGHLPETEHLTSRGCEAPLHIPWRSYLLLLLMLQFWNTKASSRRSRTWPYRGTCQKHFSSRVTQQDKVKFAGSLTLRAALLLWRLCMWVLSAQWISVLNSRGVHVLLKLFVCLCIHLPVCLMGMKNSGEGWDTKEVHSLVISSVSYVNSSLLSCPEVDMCVSTCTWAPGPTQV